MKGPDNSESLSRNTLNRRELTGALAKAAALFAAQAIPKALAEEMSEERRLETAPHSFVRDAYLTENNGILRKAINAMKRIHETNMAFQALGESPSEHLKHGRERLDAQQVITNALRKNDKTLVPKILKLSLDVMRKLHSSGQYKTGAILFGNIPHNILLAYDAAGGDIKKLLEDDKNLDARAMQRIESFLEHWQGYEGFSIGFKPRKPTLDEKYPAQK